jgi:hypothetical protein
MVRNFRNCFLRNYLLQRLYIWHTTFTRNPILLDSISGLLLIHFLLTDLVKFSTLMVNGINYRYRFLRTYLSQSLDIWHTALTRGPISWHPISCLLLNHILFTDIINFSTLMISGKKFFVTSQDHDIWYTNATWPFLSLTHFYVNLVNLQDSERYWWNLNTTVIVKKLTS